MNWVRYLVAAFIVTAPHALPGQRSVTQMHATPDGMLMNQPTTVTITAQVGNDPRLIVSSVTLVRYDINQQVVGVVGALYDDATHGDVRAGDGTFTGQLQLDEPTLGPIYFKASVAYKGSLQRVLSSFLRVDVVHQISSSEATLALTIPDAAEQQYNSYLALGASPSSARTQTVSWLLDQTGVAQAGISDNGTGIWIVYSSHLLGGVLLNPPGTKGQLSRIDGANHPLVAAAIGAPASASTTAVSQPCGNSKAVVIDLFGFSPDEAATIPTTLQQAPCQFQITTKPGTVDGFKGLGDYGVVVISSHGDTWYNGLLSLYNSLYGINGSFLASSFLGQVVIYTNEKATPSSIQANSVDLQSGRLAIANQQYYAITPQFISKYSGTFQNSIVYLSACRSAYNTSMSNAFLGAGAGSYFGYTEYVRPEFSYDNGNMLFQKLVMPDASTQQLPTVGVAFQPRTDSVTGEGASGPASFVMFGSVNNSLPGSQVANGSFETGDLSSWSIGGAGYSTAVGTSATDGSYSARIGRWDEVYSGGVNGPPQAGAEPYGYDSITQDVQIPTIPTGKKMTLSFTYEVMTYDAGIYDWFDMFIEDTNGNAQAAVVYHAGRPGTEYGAFYDTGPVTVSYDVTSFAGTTIRLFFGTRQDGYGDQTATFVDNVKISCPQ